MPLPLHTAPLPLEQLFGLADHIEVPPYQRPFSWSPANIDKLFEDLVTAAGIELETAHESFYFLGSMVFCDAGRTSSAPDAGPNLLEVVDGQQRLVTLTIMLCALRAFVGDEELSRRLSRIVEGSHDESGGPGMASRLLVSPAVRDFFFRHVQAPGALDVEPVSPDSLSGNERRILEARDQLANRLRQLDQDERNQLARYMLEDCHVVAITTGDLDKAHRIFGILNDRGQELQRSEILKAELLRGLSGDAYARALEAWDRAAARMDDRFEELFSHIRTAFGVTRPQIIQSIRQIVADVGGPEAFILEVLEPMSLAATNILPPPSSAAPEKADAFSGIAADPDIESALRSLGRLSGGDWIGAALLAFTTKRPGGIEAHRAIILEIERLAYLLRIVGLGAAKRQARFAKVCDALRTGEPIDPQQAPCFQVSREEQRSIAHHLKDLYARNVRVCKVVLMRLNDELDNAPHADLQHASSRKPVDPSEFSVEHVLPQRPPAQSEWRRIFADPEVRQKSTNSIGNLILVSPRQNDLARNADFETKRKVYASSGVDTQVPAITREIVGLQSWTPELVAEREARLLALLSRALRIDLPGVGPASAAAPDKPDSQKRADGKA